MTVLSLQQQNSFAQVSGAAFNAVAEDYDRIFTYSQIGNLQRSQVWSVADKLFSSGDCILELGCGTGYDAVHMAKQGVSVVACDESPAMINVARTRARGETYEGAVSFEICANEYLDLICKGQLFDGAFSNFGSLNCSEDLHSVVAGLAQKVRPGGRVLICMINRYCLWEVFWFLFRGQFSKAVRRLRRQGSTARFGRKEICVFYPSVARLRKIFASEFRLAQWQGIGVIVPPSYTESIFGYRSRTLRFLGWLDEKIRRCLFVRSFGDHILMEFVRKEP